MNKHLSAPLCMAVAFTALLPAASAFLSSEQAAAAIRRSGMEPARPR